MDNIFRSIVTIACFASISAFAIIANAEVPEKVLDVIRLQEDGELGKRNWDRGSYSYGPYQIKVDYLNDANEFGGTSYTIEQVRDSEEISREVVRNYLNGCKKIFESQVTSESWSDDWYFRYHNGGRGAHFKRPHNTSKIKNQKKKSRYEKAWINIQKYVKECKSKESAL